MLGWQVVEIWSRTIEAGWGTCCVWKGKFKLLLLLMVLLLLLLLLEWMIVGQMLLLLLLLRNRCLLL